MYNSLFIINKYTTSSNNKQRFNIKKENKKTEMIFETF